MLLWIPTIKVYEVTKLKIIINRRLSPKERARLDNAESKLAEEVIRRTELEDAVIELGSLFAEQDDAIVELAEMITEV